MPNSIKCTVVMPSHLPGFYSISICVVVSTDSGRHIGVTLAEHVLIGRRGFAANVIDDLPGPSPAVSGLALIVLAKTSEHDAIQTPNLEWIRVLHHLNKRLFGLKTLFHQLDDVRQEHLEKGDP
jgi:hypothetical protein